MKQFTLKVIKALVQKQYITKAYREQKQWIRYMQHT